MSILNNPLAITLLGRGVDIVGRNMLASKQDNSNSYRKETLKRLDEIQKRLNNNNQYPPQAQVPTPTQAPTPVPTQQENEDSNYSNYAPHMKVDSGCIPCSRAHLVAVKADLKEALRFAREDGLMHPEVQERLKGAEEEIVALERRDLTVEKIKKYPPELQKILYENLKKIRRLRQKILNDIHTVNDLEDTAVMASDVYSKFREETLGKN